MDMLNNLATSNPPISAHMVHEKCNEMSRTLKSISSIIPLAYICTVLLPSITLTLAGAMYMSHFIDDIGNILSNKLMKDLFWNMCVHDLKTDNCRAGPPHLRSISTNTR